MPVVPLVFLAIVALILVAKSVVLVPPGQRYVVGTLGRATRVLQPGLHILPPFVTFIAGKVPTIEQTLDVPEAGGRLQDGTAVAVKGTIRYQVEQPLLAINDVDDYQVALARLAATQWSQALAASDHLTFIDALRDAVSPMRAGAASWGITIIAADPTFSLSEEGVHVLEQRAALERQTRVLDWLADREEEPAADGRPSPEQYLAYQTWAEQAVEEHRDEIAAAQGAGDAARRAQEAAPRFATPAPQPASEPFRGADPLAISFGVARTPIPAGGTGRVEAGGRDWDARNESSVAILAGFRCAVARQDGDTLIVRPL